MAICHWIEPKVEDPIGEAQGIEQKTRRMGPATFGDIIRVVEQGPEGKETKTFRVGADRVSRRGRRERTP